MQTTIITCDRCKKELNLSKPHEAEIEEVREIKVMVEPDFSRWQAVISLHWCLKCRQETGLQKVYEDGKVKEPAAPLTHGETLEELIREVVREEISNSTGA